jgi:hypothetical protein
MGRLELDSVAKFAICCGVICMIDPYPPIRRRQKRRQEPKQYQKEHYDGAAGSEPMDVES